MAKDVRGDEKTGEQLAGATSPATQELLAPTDLRRSDWVVRIALILLTGIAVLSQIDGFRLTSDAPDRLASVVSSPSK